MPSLSSSLFSSLKNIFSAPAVTSTPAHVARKKTWKLLSCLALGATPAALVSTLFSSPVLAQSQSATVPVTVRVPNVLQLQTWGSIDVTLTAAQAAGGTVNATGGVLVQGPAATSVTTGTTPLTASLPSGVSTATATINPLYHLWTTHPGGASVTITVPTTASTLRLGGTSTTDTIDMSVASGYPTGPSGSTGMGNNFYTGNATLNFNLSNAKTAGAYSGGSITITASNP
ncbi:hypothetical protein QT990_34835 [Microcoleus sp. T3_B1]|uniref:hypothetical protein n=1 Tax=Microcoleus sp. T3_B1 TaxID=3055425 RepID=UPI002FD06821